VARQVNPLPWQCFRVKFAFPVSCFAWEDTHTFITVLATVRTSRIFSVLGKSTFKNDVLKKILDLSFMKITNGNLRLGPNDNEREGIVQSSYLPERQFL